VSFRENSLPSAHSFFVSVNKKPSFISSVLIWWPYYIAKRFSDALLQQQNEKSGPATASFDLLPATDDEFRADHLQKRYESAVRRFDRSGLVRDLWRLGYEIGGGLYLFAVLPLILVNLLRYAKPILVNWMLDSLQKHGFGQEVVVYICIITGCETIQGYLQIHHEILVRRCWLRIMITVRSAVLHKALRLSSKSMAQFSSAEISNLVSQDLQTVVEALQWLHNLWAAPLNLLLMIVSLFWLLGLPALAVLGCMLVILPANIFVMRKQAQAWEEKTESADRRTTIISDIIEGIRVVKMFAWEELFADKVSTIRKEEERALWKSYLYRYTSRTPFALI
jgi:ABC-type multidrug transport system fused ATPase/permease subunit